MTFAETVVHAHLEFVGVAGKPAVALLHEWGWPPNVRFVGARKSGDGVMSRIVQEEPHRTGWAHTDGRMGWEDGGIPFDPSAVDESGESA